MNMPLIITDADGRLIYVSPSVKVGGALRLWLSAVARAKEKTVVYYHGKAVYTKIISLGGKKYRIFTSAEHLINYFGVSEDRFKDGFFDFSEDKWHHHVSVSLKSLVYMFSEAYSAQLFEGGVRVSVRRLVSDAVVSVSPSSFALCLALMALLCAESGCEVALSYTCECGRVAIYADSISGTPVKTKAREVLLMLLYEVSATSGFKVENRLYDGKWSFKLETQPVDIGLLGFKTDSLDRFKKCFEGYIAMFL